MLTKFKWTPLLLAVLVFAADATSKWWALHHLTPEASPFIPGILQLRLITNTGAAFGIGYNHGSLMMGISAVMTALIAIHVWRRQDGPNPLTTPEVIGYGFVLGGACGNLVDRASVGRVTDFLEFAFMRFPVFNVADAFIEVGLTILLAFVLLRPAKAPEPHE